MKIPLNRKGHQQLLMGSPRPNTYAVVGGAFGDEGKGRIIDNLIESMLSRPDIKKVYVVRYQGGNNAGHTVEKNGLKLALHVVPSFVLHKKAFGIMDRGEVIHPEDLITEITYIERTTKTSLVGRLFLSQDAILCTDLERAEEILNRAKSGAAKGGTGRGISPSYAHFIDRTGFTVRDLMSPHWEDVFAKRYDQYNNLFKAFAKELGMSLAKTPVPDFAATKQTGKSATRTVGSKKEFVARLKKARNWLKKRDIVTNIEAIYRTIHYDKSIGILFEASQAAGLDAYNGTRPDVTSSDTTLSGIKAGTGGHFLERDIEHSYAVIKATYTSSVGARRMPTHVDNDWSHWVQEAAHEYGTTTGRPRDINMLDLPMLAFNLRISGAQKLVLTHVDIARKDMPVTVCTHYTDKKGNPTFYQANLADLAQVKPHYVEFPGWDGVLCQQATSYKTLPKATQQFLAFLEDKLGLPIVAVTTGPDRKDFISFSRYLE